MKILYKRTITNGDRLMTIPNGLEKTIPPGIVFGDLRAIVFTTATIPYIDAGILTEWIKKALTVK